MENQNLDQLLQGGKRKKARKGWNEESQSLMIINSCQNHLLLLLCSVATVANVANPKIQRKFKGNSKDVFNKNK